MRVIPVAFQAISVSCLFLSAGGLANTLVTDLKLLDDGRVVVTSRFGATFYSPDGTLIEDVKLPSTRESYDIFLQNDSILRMSYGAYVVEKWSLKGELIWSRDLSLALDENNGVATKAIETKDGLRVFATCSSRSSMFCSNRESLQIIDVKADGTVDAQYRIPIDSRDSYDPENRALLSAVQTKSGLQFLFDSFYVAYNSRGVEIAFKKLSPFRPGKMMQTEKGVFLFGVNNSQRISSIHMQTTDGSVNRELCGERGDRAPLRFLSASQSNENTFVAVAGGQYNVRVLCYFNSVGTVLKSSHWDTWNPFYVTHAVKTKNGFFALVDGHSSETYDVRTLDNNANPTR